MSTSEHHDRRGGKARRATLELVLRHLRRRNFVVLATVGADGWPHAAGVTYGVSAPGRDFALYVMTRTHLRKARDIAVNPNVALVVPLMRWVFRFLPPATIQVHGRADILDPTDEEGIAAFRSFWIGRRILRAYQAAQRRGETRVCFLRITPDPVVTTYMVGSTIGAVRRRMEAGAGKIIIPQPYLCIHPRSGPRPRPHGPLGLRPHLSHIEPREGPPLTRAKDMQGSPA